MEALHDQVDEGAEHGGQRAVDPEDDIHGLCQPWPGDAGSRPILCNVEENRPEAYHASRHEQDFGGMGDGCPEGGGIQVEAQGDHGDVEEEQGDVEEEEDGADGVEAGKSVRRYTVLARA